MKKGKLLNRISYLVLVALGASSLSGCTVVRSGIEAERRDKGTEERPFTKKSSVIVQFLETQILTGHTGYIYGVSISTDGTYIATGSDDKTLRIWKRSESQFALHQTLTGHTGYIYGVSISADGTYIAAGGDDKTLRIWKRSESSLDTTRP